MRYAAITLGLAYALLLSGCAGAFLEVTPMRGAPQSSHDYWAPSPDGVDEARALTGAEEDTYLPPDELDEMGTRGDPLALGQLVDLALRNSPTTRNTWATARAQAAAVGAERGDYYPQLSLETDITFARGIAASGSDAFVQRDYGAEWTLSWLLFDFGAREATIESALEQLIAANWQHDQAVLDTILGVAQAYYDLEGARRQVTASELSVADATASVQAAEARMRAKIGTAYDSLQAQTTLAQIQIDLEGYRGQVSIARGELNTALGLAANTKLGAVSGTRRPDVAQAMGDVDEMIDVARRLRPDLGAAWADVRASEADVWAATAAMLPSFSASGYVERLTVDSDLPTERGWPYSVGVTMTLPLFTGFENVNKVREARENVEVARATAIAAEQTAIEEVWSSYANLRTAEATVKTSERWIDAARKSYTAARVAYDNGLGNIIELLDAQIALSTARTQLISADTSWFTSLAQLAHDVGIFSRRAATDDLVHELSTTSLDGAVVSGSDGGMQATESR